MIACGDAISARVARDRVDLRIGVVDVTVRSDLPDVLDDLASIYSDAACRRPAEPRRREVSITVEARRRSLLARREYAISGDGHGLWTTRQTNEVLPYVEWGINWRVIATRPEYLQIHAAALARGGHGLIMAAESGFGKTTLAAGLLARGWQYLSDEFALIAPDDLRIHPFPKALCVKNGSFPVMERLGLPVWRRRHYVKALKGEVGYVNPLAGGRAVAAKACAVRLIVFPRYAENARPRLYPISRAQAAFELARHALNRNVHGARAASILSDLARGARCYALDSGPIHATCDELEHLIDA
ncbi:MAG: hypothetical protein KA354_12010 [Phycisphaerae bacterium]|nr:hypothetical protein [Phycisphaerae bacterium]